MTEAVRQFVYKFYLSPIIYDNGYNPVNTATWVLLLLLWVFLTLKLLKRLGIKIDSAFVAAVSPYIFVGASLRVLEDAGVVSPPLSYLLVTPLIYFFVFFCCVALLTITSLATFRLVGVAWFFANLGILLCAGEVEVVALWVLPAVVGVAGLFFGAVYAVAASVGPRLRFLTERLNASVLAAHLLDASSSWVGIDFLGYTGKHVVERALVEHTGSEGGSAVGMFPLKLGMLVPVLFLLETLFGESESEKVSELKILVLLVLLVVGLALAVRNTLRMILGV